MHLDDSVGRIAAALEKTGRDKNTFFVFTSDNGGSWTENAGQEYPPDNYPEGKLTAAGADRPLAYEKFGIHGRDGVNIAYCDGHVEFHAAKAAMDLIREATGGEPVKYENPVGTPVKAPK